MNLDQIVHLFGLVILGIALVYCCYSLWEDWRELFTLAKQENRPSFGWKLFSFLLGAAALLAWIFLRIRN